MLSLWLIAIVGTVPFTLISYTDGLWGETASVSEGINAIVFILFWFISSAYMGYNQKKYFLKFSLIYFTYLILSSLLGFINALFGLAIIAILLAAPFTGLGYFITTDANLIIWGSVATLVIVAIGYYGGTYFSEKVKRVSVKEMSN